MKRKGSLLIIVVILLALVEILTLVLIGAVKSYKMNTKRIKGEQLALNYAEDGLNSVINILMRDPDWDFRTAGDKCPTYGFSNTVPYSFNFQNMDYKVEILDATHNPIYNSTGTADSYFSTNKNKMWVKVTGFYYPHNDPSQYKALVLSGGNTISYQTKIIKRTIVAKITSAVPIDPFQASIFSCGRVLGLGWVTVTGKVCSPTVVALIIAGNLKGDTTCTPTSNSCNSLKDPLDGWAGDMCSDANDEGHEYTDSQVTFSGLWNHDKLAGKYCFDKDATFIGDIESVTPKDVNGDGDYSDDYLGEVPPPVMIVRGDLTVVGKLDFKGIILVMGKTNILGLAKVNASSIVSLGGINILGFAKFSHTDYSRYITATRNKISRSVWITGDKPIMTTYNGQNIVVSIKQLTPPDPRSW